MVELTGEEIQRFKDALLASFDRAELVQLMRNGFDENLETIAGTGEIDAFAYELVLWAQSQNRLDDLLTAVQAELPKNPVFTELAVDLGRGSVADDVTPQPDAQLSSLPSGASTPKISGSNAPLENAQIVIQINTGGGAYVAGNVHTDGGGFVGGNVDAGGSASPDKRSLPAISGSETYLTDETVAPDTVENRQLAGLYNSTSDERILEIIKTLASPDRQAVAEYLHERLLSRRSELQNLLIEIGERIFELERDGRHIPRSLKNKSRATQSEMDDLDKLLDRVKVYK